MPSSVQLSQEKDILSVFYKALETDTFSKLHLYHSDIHYIRAAIEERTGVKYSLAYVESAVNAFKAE
jgi:hypothetical protein